MTLICSTFCFRTSTQLIDTTNSIPLYDIYVPNFIKIFGVLNKTNLYGQFLQNPDVSWYECIQEANIKFGCSNKRGDMNTSLRDV